MRRLLFFFTLVFAVTLASGAAVGAQTDPGYGGNPPPDVGGDVVDNEGDTPDEGTPDEDVLGDETTPTSSVAAGAGGVGGGGLPVTGGDLVGLTLLGLGAVGVGAAMVTYRRRTA